MEKKIPNLEHLEKLHEEINEEINNGKTDTETIKAKYRKLALLSTYININPNTSPV